MYRFINYLMYSEMWFITYFPVESNAFISNTDRLLKEESFCNNTNTIIHFVKRVIWAYPGLLQHRHLVLIEESKANQVS